MARKRSPQLGFTLIETLIAITVLAVGMLALGAMISQMDKTTGKSRYMSVEALLASEKLEQLNRYPMKDANIAVTSGTTAGSLTSDITEGEVNYFDEVLVSSKEGEITETTTTKDASGKVTYHTLSQTPNGEVNPVDSDTAPLDSPTTLGFKRRWLIEKDVPVSGVCRITVAVSIENASAGPGSNLQMSMVRQYAQ